MSAAAEQLVEPGISPDLRAARVGRNMVLVAVANLAPALAGIGVAPIMTRGLGVTGRGDIAAGTAPMLLASIGLTLGIPEAVTYVTAKHPHLMRAAARRGFWFITGIGAVGFMGTFFAAPALSGGDRAITQLIVLGALALLPTLYVSLLRACASGLHAWELVAREQVISAVSRLAVFAALLASGQLTPLTGTLTVAFTPVLGGIVYVRLRHRSGALATLTTADLAPLRPMYSFGLRIWLGSISGILLARLDQTIMTPLSSTHQLGLYAVAVNVSEVTLVINSAVRDVTFSADAAEQESGRLTSSARISGALSMGFGLLIAVSMLWWLPLLFGSGFRDSIPPCAILIASMAFATPGSVAGAALSARGRPGLRSAALTVACLANIVAMLVLVPGYGATGAALATAVGSVIASTLNIVFLARVSELQMRQFYGLRAGDVRIITGSVARLRARR